MSHQPSSVELAHRTTVSDMLLKFTASSVWKVLLTSHYSSWAPSILQGQLFHGAFLESSSPQRALISWTPTALDLSGLINGSCFPFLHIVNIFRARSGMEEGIIPHCTKSIWLSALQYCLWRVLCFYFSIFCLLDALPLHRLGNRGLLLGSCRQEQKIEKGTDANQRKWSGNDPKSYIVVTASILLHF